MFALVAVGVAVALMLVVAVAAAFPRWGKRHSHQNLRSRKTSRGSSQMQPALLDVPLFTSLTAPGPVERAPLSQAGSVRGNSHRLVCCCL